MQNFINQIFNICIKNIKTKNAIFRNAKKHEKKSPKKLLVDL